MKVSGICSVVYDDGKDTFEVTCVEGKPFPDAKREGCPLRVEVRGYALVHGELQGAEVRS